MNNTEYFFRGKPPFLKKMIPPARTGNRCPTALVMQRVANGPILRLDIAPPVAAEEDEGVCWQVQARLLDPFSTEGVKYVCQCWSLDLIHPGGVLVEYTSGCYSGEEHAWWRDIAVNGEFLQFARDKIAA